MKTLLLSLVAVFLCLGVYAQGGYIVLDSEKIYQSIARYNQAVISLENQAELYQDEIDKDYKEVEELFTTYQSRKAYLSQTDRSRTEAAIIAKEKEIKERQKSLFGEDGALEQKRKTLFEPIENMVDNIIADYAKTNGYTLVLDKNSEKSMLYYSPSIDKTQEIINKLNQ